MRRGVTCFTVAVLMLLTVSAATASALSNVRFLNAAAGAPVAHLNVTSTVTGVTTGAGGDSTFGEVTPYAAAPSGLVHLVLVAPGLHAQLTRSLSPGSRYTVIATSSGGRAALHLYLDGGARAGTARLRVIHAAPELGAPDITLAGRPIAQHVPFAASSGYAAFTPGSYALAVVSPSMSQPIAQGNVSLAAGTATTAFVIGSAGKSVQVVSAQDSAVTPGGPPDTGLGGLATGGGRRWSLILLAALAGAALAGGLQLAVRRRR